MKTLSIADEPNLLLSAKLESSPEVRMFALDRDYCYITFNKQHQDTMKAIWGKEIINGMNMLDLVDNLVDRSKIKTNFDRALSGESYDSIEEYETDSPLKPTWHTYWSPIYAGRKIIGLTCLVLNITKQKRAEETLKNNLFLTEAVLESIDNGILVVSTDSTVLRTNNRFVEMWRIPPEVIETANDITLMDYVLDQLSYPGAFINGIEMLYYTPESSGDDLIYFKDGRIFERTSRPMIVDGKATGRVWSFLDVTSRKHAEQQVLLHQERLSLALEASGDGIWDINLQTKRVPVNARFLEMLGYPVDNLVLDLDFIVDLIPPEDRKSLRQAIYNREHSYINSCTIELRMLGRDGSWRWILVRFRVVEISPEGHPIRIIGNNTDTTERHRREEELRFLSTHDKLTGLYNRLYVEEFINNDSIVGLSPVTLVMGDVNGLKLINDTFGHTQGDRLLSAFAERLIHSVGDKGVVARWGGDEFLIVLPGFDDSEAMVLIADIQHRCKEIAIDLFPLSVALGHATRISSTQPIEEVMREAEDRMYHNKLIEGKSARSAIISALRETLAAKTCETEEHCRRMQVIALRVVEFMGLPDNIRDDVLLLALLHDIGKIGIPETILTKPGSLTPEEMNTIKKHSEIGFRIASASYEITHIAEGILSHHEWWNGNGYPQGLKGTNIPLISRIIAVIDAYDAMTSDRVYRSTLTHEEAIAELRRASGTQFDPEVVDIVAKVV